MELVERTCHSAGAGRECSGDLSPAILRRPCQLRGLHWLAGFTHV